MSISKTKKGPIFNFTKCLVGRFYVFVSIILSFSENSAYSHLSYTMLSRKILGRMSFAFLMMIIGVMRAKRAMIVYGHVGSEDVKMCKFAE